MGKIESMLETIRAAHLSIFARRRRLMDQGHDDARTLAPLTESARIVFLEAPAATREAYALADRWGEQQLLDPDNAPATRAMLDEEIKRAEARLTELLRRQQQLAREHQKLADEPPEPPSSD